MGTAPTFRQLSAGEIRLRVHGVREPGKDDSRVSAAVFASKLAELVRALRAADESVNGGKPQHDYVIVGLSAGSAVVEIAEEPLRRKTITWGSQSGVVAFEDCIDAITDGASGRARAFGSCPQHIFKLANGAEKRYGYGELWVNGHNLKRVDNFLLEQARAVQSSEVAISKTTDQQWFRGNSYGTFDGRIKFVDTRGTLPLVKLILSSGGKALDCVLRGMTEAQLGPMLGKRVRIEGRAFYDGKGGLPRRIDSSKMPAVINENVDFTKWKGSFTGAESGEWNDFH